MQPWRVEQSHGDAGAFHTADPVAERSATFHTVQRPTLVLGSTQTDDSFDPVAAVELGVEVVRRRSGGGAVLLIPGEFVWLDLVIPTGDPLWLADVGASMVWVGELWQRSLATLGEGAASVVHCGPLVRSQWSGAVCWAGVGTGELMGGANERVGKLVGVSQRRTRDWVRFQSMCHLQWRPETVASLVAPPKPLIADLAPVAAVVTIAESVLRSALVDQLP